MFTYKIDRDGRLYRYMDNVGPFKYWHCLGHRDVKLKEDYYFEAEDNNTARLIFEVGGYD